MTSVCTSVEALPEPARARREGIVNGVAFQRYEYKYLVPPDWIDPIRAFVRPYCQMDRFAEREPGKCYTITSLYLDSAGYKTYWDKEHEVPNRFKLRVRTYGSHNEGPVKFEVKRRFNDIFRKTSVIVPAEDWPALLAPPRNGQFSAFNKPERAGLDDFIRLTHTIGAAPKMLVRYERQAFTSNIDRYVRVSFDRHIRYQPSRACDLTGRTDVWRYCDDATSLGERGPCVILELKFTTTAPVWLRDLVRAFGLMRRGFSKYGSAVRRTLGAARTDRDLCLAVPAMCARGAR